MTYSDNFFFLASIIVILFLIVASIIIIINIRIQNKFKQIAYVDTLTGLSSMTKFHLDVKSLLPTLRPNEYCFIYLDIDNFNYINDSFGYDVGNKVLCGIAKHFAANIDPSTEFVAHVNADLFVFFVRTNDVESKFAKIVNIKDSLSDILPTHYSLIFSAGIYIITNPQDDQINMIDKASLTRKSIKGNHTNAFAYYNSTMNDALEWKKEITLSMEKALVNEEFHVFLQPKVLFKDCKIVGAEALVRWFSPTRGMIAPDKFIGIFEQNGFIKKLDFFVLEQVCKLLSKWSTQPDEFNIIPISINFSKLHIRNEQLAEEILAITKKYNVSPKYLEIELTESVMLENLQAVVELANTLRANGFRVSIDDFGSGYSSLNFLKDLPVDILKIDKGFLNASANNEKGKLIIAKVIEMAKALRLITVVEGVETKEQQDLLRKMSCDIAQGFYYAKPMPIDEFETFSKYKLAHIDDINATTGTIPNGNSSNYDIPKEFEMDNWELYVLGQNINIGLMKGYLDDDPVVQYINKKALDFIGYTPKEFAEICGNRIIAVTHPDDVKIIRDMAAVLLKNSAPVHFEIRAIHKNGSVKWLAGRASCTMDHNMKPVGIYSFQDITREKLDEKKMRTQKEQLIVTEKKLQMAMGNFNVMMFEYFSKEKKIIHSDYIMELYDIPKEVYPIPDMLGHFEAVAPEYRDSLKKCYEEIDEGANFSQAEIKTIDKNGQAVWCMISLNNIFDEHGNVIATIGTLQPIDKAEE